MQRRHILPALGRELYLVADTEKYHPKQASKALPTHPTGSTLEQDELVHRFCLCGVVTHTKSEQNHHSGKSYRHLALREASQGHQRTPMGPKFWLQKISLIIPR